MVKYIVIVAIVVIVVSFAICGISEICLSKGLLDKEIMAYAGKEELDVKLEKENKLARIKIEDSYVKGGVKYLIFTTDVSRQRRFLMSEEEYDKHIGKGNDAVDCTIWRLTENNEVYRAKYLGYPGIDCEDVIKGIQKIDVSWEYGGSDCVCVTSAYGKRFRCGDYCITLQCKEEGVVYYYSFAENNMKIERYSFLGETDFTEEEVEEYKTLLDKAGKDIVEICRVLSCGGKGK